MEKKKKVDDRDKFYNWLNTCPYSFHYKYEMDGTITLKFKEDKNLLGERYESA